MFLISSLTLHDRLSRRWAFFCQSLTEINIAVQQLDEVGRQVKLWSHIGGGHYVSVTTGFRCVVPTTRSKRPETDEKGDRSEFGSMGANEKDRRSDKQRSSRFRRGTTVLHARGPPRDVRMSRVLAIPEARIKSSKPIRSGTLSKKTQTLCRMHVGVSTRPSHVRRIQARVAHLLLRRSPMSVLAQYVLPLQNIVHHSSSSVL